ncbi:hypothetical protein ACFFUE_05315 [Bergeyella porcorum]|uniref:hypothetical protein n=1 Tax=Bergeyella porcorum TaxID=1735111 RepID=UPI0035E928F9
MRHSFLYNIPLALIWRYWLITSIFRFSGAVQLTDRQFISTIIKDYNFYTGKE